MHLKFILRRDDGTQAQLAMTADATATVGDLATALGIGDPERRNAAGHRNPTLKLEHNAFDPNASGRVLNPARGLVEAGIRSGSRVSITAGAAAPAPAARPRGRAVAVLRVLEGPDAGREFALPPGNSTIGTKHTADVVLSDPGVSAVHAAVSVGESIEISNLAGPSGLVVGGRAMQRALLGVSDIVRLAGTSIMIVHIVRPGLLQSDSPVVEFNRSPRVVARFEERRFAAPKLPQRPEPEHFPLVSTLLPLPMGLVYFAITKSLLAVGFIALSPLLMLGMYFDQKRQNRKKRKLEAERFADGLRALAADLTAAQRVEVAVRLSERPALPEVVDAVHRLGPLMWTHRPEHPGFLSVRLGLGDAASRCHVEGDDEPDAEPGYREQLTSLKEEFAQVKDVPIVADLTECGALGVCGPRGLVDGVARGLVMQLIGLHSPAELAVAAFSSPHLQGSWDWLEWIPHTGSLHSPLAGNHLTDSVEGGVALLSRLEDLVKQRAEALATRTAPRYGPVSDASASLQEPALTTPAVVVLVEDTAPIDRARMTRLAERGSAVSVHVVWVATQVSSLPAACRTYLLVENPTQGATVGEVRHGRHNFPVACETLAVDVAEQVALLMAPVVDVGAAVEDASDLPRTASYLGLTDPAFGSDPTAVIAQWTSNDSVVNRTGPVTPLRTAPSLRALVGSTGTEDFHLDLREQGPHALVGGTTGSGKSEFLQAWVMGMAAAHSPDRVTFLLVDYKGGAAFAECNHLPHTVGLVTDLSPHLVRRALTSLRAEIKHREELLSDKNAKDLVSLQQSGDPDAPPSLVIIVDEFAALASEVPEFVDGVIDVAQRGRSLGLHLILATQRPAGVIKASLRANTNLRIALRLNDVDDSLDVVDDKQAAYFPPEIPGRAVAKTGPGRLITFQAAYVGGRSDDQPDRARIDLCEFRFGKRRQWRTELPSIHTGDRVGPNDISRIVATVTRAAGQLRLPTPRKPWLPPLAAVCALEDLPTPAREGQLVIGRCDLPGKQSQPVGYFDPDLDGNMAIIGTGGAGKSTALRTLAVSAALAPGDGPVHVYGFDFGSGSLRVLEALPHVGAIVSGDDDERIARVLRRLTGVLDDRADRFARVHAASISDYRKLSGNHTEPRILLLIDGIGAFRDAYEFIGQSTNFAMFSQLVSDGRSLGLHVVVTGDRPGALSTSLASTMQRRLYLRLANDDDYAAAGVPSDVLTANSPRGRGIMARQEFQMAVYGGDANVSVQAAAIERLATAMTEDGFAAPAPVQRLPEAVPLESLPSATSNGLAVIGLGDQDLSPVGFAPRGLLMVTGPPGSGRSTALLTLAQAVRRQDPATRVLYIAPSASAISGLDIWSDVAVGVDQAIELANRVTPTLDAGAPPQRMVAVMESIAGFGDTAAESELTTFVKAMSESAMLVIGESEVSTWSQIWMLGQPFKSARRGLVLAPTGLETSSLLSTELGRVRNKQYPPGRGVLIEKGNGVWLHVANPVT
ncbi:FtsK/SpoIIIE domain-containing protein [Mycobacterium sp. 141]|uniref:FtsK/SpoIIIE domain-containing protein n=1 Tax=Mycobacterium sp. 141 TaxID=1120797 RepID=UPI00036EFA68|nr:FtsK/SpoIIIE domain-containing protein [Mycobacterium sp. 141]